MEEDKELAELRKKKKKELQDRVKGVKIHSKAQFEKGPIVELTLMNFNHIIKDNSQVIVDFWSPSCMPCRAMEPIYVKLAREYAGKVIFGKLNIDQNVLIATQYGVMAVPTFLFFKGGQLVNKIQGAVGENPLKRAIQQLAYHVKKVQGDIGQLGENYVVMAPDDAVKIWKSE